MKKLLVLALVLSVASMASAALQISVNGDNTAAPITLAPSDTAILGIWTDAAIQYQAGTYYVLVANVNGGSIDYLTGAAVLADSGVMVEHSVDAQGFTAGTGIDVLPPMNGLGGGAFIMDLTAGVTAGTNLLGGIVFHCNAPGDVVIQLFETDFATITLVDSAVIHQLVPEPMTMGLLGLGGLFLRRRK